MLEVVLEVLPLRVLVPVLHRIQDPMKHFELHTRVLMDLLMLLSWDHTETEYVDTLVATYPCVPHISHSHLIFVPGSWAL